MKLSAFVTISTFLLMSSTTEGQSREAPSDTDPDSAASAVPDGDPVALGVTPMYSWSPSPTAQFKTAAVCQHVNWDFYGVAAVFTVDVGGGETEDQVWYFLVDGLSTWPSYGQLVGPPVLLGSYWLIHHVDCTQNDSDRTWVAWDRVAEDTPGNRVLAVVASIRVSYDPLEDEYYPWVHWTESVGGECLHPNDPDLAVYAANPQIAWTPAWDLHFSGGIITATNEYSETAGQATGSGQCFEAYDAWSMGFLGSSTCWPFMSHALDWDIEWNGSDRYVALVRFQPEPEPGPRPTYFSCLRNRDASRPTPGMFQISPEESFGPSGSIIVYSANSANPGNLMVGLTNKRTYWINRDGTLSGQFNWTSSDANPSMTGCEYWGTLSRIAHSFASYRTPYPYKYWTTHRHWPGTSGPSLEIALINQSHVPVSCSASPSADPEVLLVSTRPNPVGAYWNIEAM